MSVDWEDLFRHKSATEDLIASLLIRMYPGAVAIDGAGGDGGRDVEREHDGELTFWEVKGFPDRLSKSKTRKTQIEESLVEAAKHQPDHWWLVLPLNLNPAELKWFNGVKVKYPFIAGWRGRTWLDAHLADYPALIRSAKPVKEELLDRAAQYGLERAVLADGVPELVQRVKDLAALGNELSPDHAIDIGVRDGQAWVEISPKDPGGGEAVALHLHVDFDAAEDADLKRKVDAGLRHGDPDPVHLPARTIRAITMDGAPGLGIDRILAGQDLTVQPLVEDIDQRMQLSIYEPGSWLPVATVPFRMRKRGHGYASTTQVGRDAAETLELRIRAPRLENDAEVVPGDVSCTFTALDPGAILPSAAVPAMRLIAAAHAPNIIKMTIEGLPLGDALCPTVEPEVQRNRDRLLGAADDLALLQEMTGSSFPMPEQFTGGDIRALSAARRMLQGERVQWLRGTMKLDVDSAKVADFLASFDSDGRFSIAWEQSAVLTIGGHHLDLGPIGVTALSARLKNAKALRRHKSGSPDPTGLIESDDGWFYAVRLNEFSGERGRVVRSVKGVDRFRPIETLPAGAEGSEGQADLS